MGTVCAGKRLDLPQQARQQTRPFQDFRRKLANYGRKLLIFNYAIAAAASPRSGAPKPSVLDVQSMQHPVQRRRQQDAGG